MTAGVQVGLAAASVPRWLQSLDPRLNLLGTAVWLWRMDEEDAGVALARAITRCAVADVGLRLDEVACRVTDYEMCREDPRYYAFLNLDSAGSSPNSWAAWSELECEDIAGEVRLLLEALLIESDAR